MKERKGTRYSPGETGFPCRLVIDGDRIRIEADLPNVSEEKIRIDLEKRTLTITATNREDLHRMSIALPFAAQLRTKKFSRGILEVTLERSDH